MITLEIPETKRRMYLPEHLGECDTQQYKDMCELIFKYNKKEILYDTFRIQALYKLLNLTPGETQLSEAEEENKYANIYALSGFIDNFFEPSEENEAARVIRQDYTQNHIPFVEVNGFKYYGPQDAFRNVTFGEYTDAINLFLDYEKTKDYFNLQLIMAIFFRKKRQTYNESAIEQRAKLFKKLSIGELYGFYLCLASMHKYLTNCVLSINGNEIDFSLLFKEDGEKPVTSDMPGLGLRSIEFQLAESGVFGPLKEVRKTNLMEVLIRLYDLTKREKDERARQKAAEAEAKKKNRTA